MRRYVAVLLFFAFLLVGSGCSKENALEENVSFRAVILEVNDGSVLVEALPEEDIRRSSDKIQFSSKELEDIGAGVGDTVSVTYDGVVMESYPAQIRVQDWGILEKAQPGGNTPEAIGGESEETPEAGEDTAYRFQEYKDGEAYMCIALPEGWECEDVQTEGEKTFIPFYLTENENVRLQLEYHSGGIGICGTGVTFTDVEFQNGLSATACTEDYGEAYWFLLMYKEPYRKYTVSAMIDNALWSAYEDEIFALFEGVTLGIENAGSVD